MAARKANGKWTGRGTRQERGYGAEWQRVRKVVLARDCHLCLPCRQAGRMTPARQVDHITNKAAGGTDAADNLQAICDECHKAKTQQEAKAAQHGERPRLAFTPDGRPVWP